MLQVPVFSVTDVANKRGKHHYSWPNPSGGCVVMES